MTIKPRQTTIPVGLQQKQIFLSLLIDGICAALAPWLLYRLQQSFHDMRWYNLFYFVAAYLLFCKMIALIRRLPHDQVIFTPDPNAAKLGTWAGFSVMVFTILLMMAAAHTTLTPEMIEYYKTSAPLQVLVFVGGWGLVFVLFYPMWLYTMGQPPQFTTSTEIHAAESGIVLASNLCSQVALAYVGWLLAPHLKPIALDKVAYWQIALLITMTTPVMLLLIGSPRVLLTLRRFSWTGLFSLVASMAWYIVATFMF